MKISKVTDYAALKRITVLRTRSIICKGPKYKLLSTVINTFREEIAGFLQKKKKKIVIDGASESMLNLML